MLATAPAGLGFGSDSPSEEGGFALLLGRISGVRVICFCFGLAGGADTGRGVRVQAWVWAERETEAGIDALPVFVLVGLSFYRFQVRACSQM